MSHRLLLPMSASFFHPGRGQIKCSLKESRKNTGRHFNKKICSVLSKENCHQEMANQAKQGLTSPFQEAGVSEEVYGVGRTGTRNRCLADVLGILSPTDG